MEIHEHRIVNGRLGVSSDRSPSRRKHKVLDLDGLLRVALYGAVQLCTPRVARRAVTMLTMNCRMILRVSLFEFFMVLWLLRVKKL